MKKIILSLIAVFILSACSAKAVLVKKKVEYDPTTEARVRIYQKNGNATTRVHNDTSCQDIANNPKKGRSRNPFSKDNFHNGLPKFTLKSTSIGIPMTETSTEVLKRDSLTDTLSFIEKKIDGGKPVVIGGSYTASMGDKVLSCIIDGEFTPEPGKDYEIIYGLISNKSSSSGIACRMYINEIQAPSNGQAIAKTDKEILYKKCE